MPVPLLGRQKGADTQRLTRGEAAALSHDTLPQDVKSVRALLQKPINNMHNKYNYSGITMMAALWAGKSKID